LDGESKQLVEEKYPLNTQKAVSWPDFVHEVCPKSSTEGKYEFVHGAQVTVLAKKTLASKLCTMAKAGETYRGFQLVAVKKVPLLKTEPLPPEASQSLLQSSQLASQPLLLQHMPPQQPPPLLQAQSSLMLLQLPHAAQQKIQEARKRLVDAEQEEAAAEKESADADMAAKQMENDAGVAEQAAAAARLQADEAAAKANKAAELAKLAMQRKTKAVAAVAAAKEEVVKADSLGRCRAASAKLGEVNEKLEEVKKEASAAAAAGKFDEVQELVKRAGTLETERSSCTEELEAARAEVADLGMAMESEAASDYRTFETSNFKVEYDKYKAGTVPPIRIGTQVLSKVTEFLFAYCQLHGLCSNEAQQAVLEKFQADLQKETFDHSAANIFEKVGPTAALLWTSSKVFKGMPQEHCKPLYRLLNRGMTEDNKELVPSLAGFARALNESLLVAGPRADVAMQKFPPHNKTWRGGGFGLEATHPTLSPSSLREFFTEGTKYRVPGFLATSFDESVATFFARNMSKARERVIWVVHFDERGNKAHSEYDDKYRCKHVNYVDTSHIQDAQGQPTEAEYLFAPYSAFTVRSVTWAEPTADPPIHRIELDPLADNMDADKCPVAPWF